MSNQLGSFISAYGTDFEFDFDNRILLNWYPQRIIEKTSQDSNALELGLGHGYTSRLFEQHYSQYSIIEGSKEIIAQYRASHPETRAKILHSYFEHFESTKKFDVIIMGFILEHVDDPALILTKFKNMLADDGKCYIAVPNAESLHRRFGKEAGLLDDIMRLGEGDIALGHKRAFTVHKLTALLEDCGYNILNKEGIFLKPMTTAQLIKLNLSSEVLRGMCEVGVAYPELCAGLLFEVYGNK